jgi:hypothetical protein
MVEAIGECQFEVFHQYSHFTGHSMDPVQGIGCYQNIHSDLPGLLCAPDDRLYLFVVLFQYNRLCGFILCEKIFDPASISIDPFTGFLFQ